MEHEASCGCVLSNRAADPPVHECPEAKALLDKLPSSLGNIWDVNAYIQHVAHAKRSVIDPRGH